MSGDRCVSDEHMEKHILPHPKIKKVGNALIGGCGNLTPLGLVLEMPELANFDYVPNLYMYLWNTFVPRVKKLLTKNEVQEDHEQDDDSKKDNCLLELLICAQNKAYVVDIKTKGIELYEVSAPTAAGSGTPYWKAAYKSWITMFESNSYKPSDATRHAHIVTAQITNTCDDNIDIITGGGLID